MSAASISRSVPSRALRTSRFLSPASEVHDCAARSYSSCSARRRRVSSAIRAISRARRSCSLVDAGAGADADAFLWTKPGGGLLSVIEELQPL
jgi:hypothetical protein